MQLDAFRWILDVQLPPACALAFLSFTQMNPGVGEISTSAASISPGLYVWRGLLVDFTFLFLFVGLPNMRTCQGVTHFQVFWDVSLACQFAETIIAHIFQAPVVH